MRRLSYRYQRTLARSVDVCGIGFLTGANVRLRFQPAEPSSGIVFLRTDLRPAVAIPAHVAQVTGTQRKTTLGHAPAHVALVEHVLAALSGMRIDNCVVELDAPEPPGLDGSSQSFVEAILQAGHVLQAARRAIWTVTAPLVVAGASATLAIHPTAADVLKISYLLDYGSGTPISRQAHTQVVSPESFANDLAACRTFLLEAEALELRRNGIGLRTTTSDLIVMGGAGPINNQLRYANELARHKVLDIVGDLALLGHDLRGHVVAYRSGHPLNVELVRTMSEAMRHSASEVQRSAA